MDEGWTMEKIFWPRSNFSIRELEEIYDLLDGKRTKLFIIRDFNITTKNILYFDAAVEQVLQEMNLELALIGLIAVKASIKRDPKFPSVRKQKFEITREQ